jgi:hypothetical protein
MAEMTVRNVTLLAGGDYCHSTLLGATPVFVVGTVQLSRSDVSSYRANLSYGGSDPLTEVLEPGVHLELLSRDYHIAWVSV